MDENAGRIGKADRVLSPTATEPEVSAHSGDAPLRVRIPLQFRLLNEAALAGGKWGPLTDGEDGQAA